MRIERNNPTASVRGYELCSKKKAGLEGAPPSFEENLATQRGSSVGERSSAAVPPSTPADTAGVSGEEYLKLYQDSAAANSAASGAAEHKALIAAADAASLESTGLSEPPKAAASAEQTVTILPTDSTQVKLAKLQQIAEASDYTGMSYEEIYTTIWNRYNDAFDGRLSAICSGLSGPSDWNYINNQFWQETGKVVFYPLRAEFVAQGMREQDAAYDKEYQKRITDIKSAPFGYSGMNCEQREAAILEKYAGKNSFLDFLSMQGELFHTGVYYEKMGSSAAYQYLIAMRGQIEKPYVEAWLQANGPGTTVYVSPGLSLTKSEWENKLRSPFDTQSFFTGLKESINKTIYPDFGYDIKGLFNKTIDDFTASLSKYAYDVGGVLDKALEDFMASMDERREG